MSNKKLFYPTKPNATITRQNLDAIRDQRDALLDKLTLAQARGDMLAANLSAEQQTNELLQRKLNVLVSLLDWVCKYWHKIENDQCTWKIRKTIDEMNKLNITQGKLPRMMQLAAIRIPETTFTSGFSTERCDEKTCCRFATISSSLR